MNNLVPTIGLEIHAELRTNSKMFCGCKNDPHVAVPNSHICPVCVAHPGVLPVVNAQAVRHVLRVGVALGGTLADFTEFDRKNYFYPDIPKGYQISQYKYPLVSGGSLGNVAITRIHLEEDTARSSHTMHASMVDFNRAGVPLLELVTEPVIHSANEAVAFARDLRLCLRYLGVSEANLEKGEMRIEANISLAPEGAGRFGTKVEIKNLNSFRALEGAIAYEIRRQSATLEQGERVQQETRGWDEGKQRTVMQRVKEDSHDYRYFPEPDIPKLRVSRVPGTSEELIRNMLPTLPWELRISYHEANIPDHVVELLLSNDILRDFYEKVRASLKDERSRALCVHYITTDLWGHFSNGRDDVSTISNLDPDEFSDVVTMATNGEISSRGAKILIEAWLKEGGSMPELAKRLGILQISDNREMDELAQRVLQEQPNVVLEYMNGKEQAFEFLVGHGMRLSRGSANPEILRTTLKGRLVSLRKDTPA